MLRTRPVAMILLALSPMALSPQALSANGGSFFDFDRTYYVPVRWLSLGGDDSDRVPETADL